MQPAPTTGAPIPASTHDGPRPRELAAPIAVRALDLDDLPDGIDLGPARGGGRYTGLHGVLMRGGRPVGTIVVPADAEGRVRAGDLAAAAARVELPPPPPPAPGPGERPAGTVVVTTCDNPGPLLRCLGSIVPALAAGDRIVVVENRPAASRVRAALAEAFGGDRRIDYVEERRPGLGRARNAGLAAVGTPFVAFTDDDVIAEPTWSDCLFGTLAAHPAAAVATGLIAPLALETGSQLLLERFAGFGKGYRRRVFRLSEPPPGDPLFPYAAGTFGSGANLACRTAAMRALGGFDPYLGTGTPARGGEDLDLFTRAILAGHELVYEPGALVWHEHPDTPERLRRQAYGYGAGLGAAIAKLVACGPSRTGLLRRIPAGARHMLASDSPKNARKGPAYPRRLTLMELAGLASGPVGYARSRLAGRPAR